MGSDAAIVEIIILAMVALFIGLRLRSVLGKHRPEDPPGNVSNFKTGSTGPKGVDPAEAMGFGRSTFSADEKGSALPGSDDPVIRKVFGIQGPAGYFKFIEGAKSAYQMTLEGFWSGDMSKMEPYIDPDVLRNFKTAISERAKKGLKLENRLVEILETDLDQAELEDNRAEITLKFKSEIVSVLRDKNGKLLEGNVSDTIKVTDIWTFARNIKNRDPNWVLVATEGG